MENTLKIQNIGGGNFGLCGACACASLNFANAASLRWDRLRPMYFKNSSKRTMGEANIQTTCHDETAKAGEE